MEEAGRNIRREAFERAAQKYGAAKIALAHHKNDNAETLLMNLVRGTGLNGMTGIKPGQGSLCSPASLSGTQGDRGISGTKWNTISDRSDKSDRRLYTQ